MRISGTILSISHDPLCFINYYNHKNMKVKILSFLLVLCTLKLSSQEIPEISQRDIDGKLWFVQIYKENCRSCAE